MQKRKNRTAEISLVLGMTIVWLALPTVVASPKSPLWMHLACQFCHANVFHLAGNMYVLWLMAAGWRKLTVAYTLSIPATYATWIPAMGFSSCLYALIGMELYGKCLSRTGWAVFIAVNAATLFIPGIAVGVHATAFALGYVYAFCRDWLPWFWPLRRKR